MKYFYIGGGILAVLLTVSLLLGLAVANRATETAELLSRAAETMDAGDFSTAREEGMKAAQLWETHAHFLSTLVAHDELDEIAEGFRRLSAYAKEEKRAEFRSQCQVLIFRLEHVAQMDLPFYYNFLSFALDPSPCYAV